MSLTRRLILQKARHHPTTKSKALTACKRMFSPTWLSPSTADHPRPLRLTHTFLTVAQAGRLEKTNPTTPHTQPLPGITCTRFSHPPLSLATTHGLTIVF